MVGSKHRQEEHSAWQFTKRKVRKNFRGSEDRKIPASLNRLGKGTLLTRTGACPDAPDRRKQKNNN